MILLLQQSTTERRGIYSQVRIKNIVSVDAVDFKVPKKVRECWLVARFGLERIMEVRNIIRAIPETLTEAQRKEVLSNTHDLEQALMSDFNYHIDGGPSISTAPILAPPTHTNVISDVLPGAGSCFQWVLDGIAEPSKTTFENFFGLRFRETSQNFTLWWD